MWQLRKNYKSNEKDHIARVIQDCHDAGQVLPSLTVGDRQVDLHRIRRHVKSQQGPDVIKKYLVTRKKTDVVGTSNEPQMALRRRQKRVDATLEDKGLSAASTSLQVHSPSRAVGPARHLALNTTTGRVEIVLEQVRNYIQGWVLQGPAVINSNSRVCAGFPLPAEEEQLAFTLLRTMAIKLTYGRDIIVDNPTVQAWQLMNEGCQIMDLVLSKQSRSLMRLLLSTFGREGWSRFPELRAHLLQHFAKLAIVRLGRFHPLTVILFNFQEVEVLEMVLESAFRLLLDVLGEGTCPTDDELQDLRVDYCSLLKERGNYVAAESYGRRFLAQNEHIHGRHHESTRDFLLQLARVYRYQKLYVLATQTLNDALGRTHEALGTDIDIDGVYAHRDLGWVHEELGEPILSQYHWRAANDAALRIFGLGTEEHANLAARATESLRRQCLPLDGFLV